MICITQLDYWKLRPMALNVKNAEAERVLRELMELTGETQAAAIRTSAAERLARLRRHSRKDRINRLISQLQDEARATGEMSTEDLYGNDGLPR